MWMDGECGRFGRRLSDVSNNPNWVESRKYRIPFPINRTLEVGTHVPDFYIWLDLACQLAFLGRSRSHCSELRLTRSGCVGPYFVFSILIIYELMNVLIRH